MSENRCEICGEPSVVALQGKWLCMPHFDDGLKQTREVFEAFKVLAHRAAVGLGSPEGTAP